MIINNITNHNLYFKTKLSHSTRHNLRTEPAKEQVGEFFLGKTLGQGTFGKVKIGIHSLTGEKAAIKILDKVKLLDDYDNARINREIKILKSILHHNIIQVYSVIESPTTIFVIMEYANGGELFDYICLKRRLSETEACRFFHQIIDGVEYIHKLGIAHRDLKPENLLLDHKKEIKIADFGLSNLYSNGNLLKTPCGSPCYAAPEMLQGKMYNGLKVDIWSCGIILFIMLCGYLPFDDGNDIVLYHKIIEGNYAISSSLSSNAKDLIKRILVNDPLRRLTIEEIRRHPWFNLFQQIKNDGLLITYHVIPVDEAIVNEMSSFGYSKEDIRNQVQNNRHNNVTTHYYLLVKRNMKRGISSVSDFFSKKFHDYLKKKILVDKIYSAMLSPTYYLANFQSMKEKTLIEPLSICQHELAANPPRNCHATEMFGVGKKIGSKMEEESITRKIRKFQFKKRLDIRPINHSNASEVKEHYEKYISKPQKANMENKLKKGYIDTSSTFERHGRVKNRTFMFSSWSHETFSNKIKEEKLLQMKKQNRKIQISPIPPKIEQSHSPISCSSEAKKRTPSPQKFGLPATKKTMRLFSRYF